MHDYLFSSEIVRFAFVFGICVSMMLYERMHLTTGSIVVPVVAVFLVYPMVVLATFVNALLSYVIMNHFLRKHFMLYGRAKFTLMALISISIQTIMLKLSPSGPWLWERNIPLFVGAGYVVPALIAHDLGRQGIKRTTKAVLLAGVIVALPFGLALLLRLNGVNDLAPLAGFGTVSIANRWIPLAVLLSAASSWGVAHSTFATIFWKSIRQLYRHYRPVVEIEANVDEDDYSSDVLVEVEVVPDSFDLFDEFDFEFEPEFEPTFEDQFEPEPATASASLEEFGWPYVEHRAMDRPWANRPAAKIPANVANDLLEVDWSEFVPNVYSIDSTGWSAKGNKRWQDAHPDAWQDADRWLAEALTPQERNSRVA